MVVLLKERGINDISIGEGRVLRNPKDMELGVDRQGASDRGRRQDKRR